MISNHLPLSLLLAVSFSAVLAGCQSNPSKSSTLTATSVTTAPVISQKIVQTKAPKEEQEIVVIDTEVTNETATEATTLQWASNYHWKLAQVKNKQGNLINISTDAPITLEVAPSSMSLTQGCQHFAINFLWMSAPPFEYGSELNERPSDCKDTPDNKISKSNLEALFPKDSILKLGVELLPLTKNIPVNTQIASKNLVVKIENGNTLTFVSTPEAFKKLTGLPINKALLESYNWRLLSAVRNIFDDKGQIISRQSISDFYHPDHHISLEFRSSPDSPYVAFNSNCNGSNAPYFLLNDNTLKVSNILSTAMNCGKTGDRIETALFDLMRNSSSQLTLSLQPSLSLSATAKNQTDMPRYNLLQTMITGETLVWQNAIKDVTP